MEKNCATCRDWSGCIGKEHYVYADIQFCRHQILWIISNRDTLLKGQWVEAPEHLTPRTQRSRSHAAPFENPAIVIGEVEERLKQVPLLRRQLCLIEVPAVMSWGAYINLSRETKDTVNYLCGFHRRAESQNFTQWKADRDYRWRQKNDKKNCQNSANKG